MRFHHNSLIVAGLFTLTVPMLSACAIEGSGSIETIEPPLEDRTIAELELNFGLEAVVSQGETAQVSITGDDNLLAELVVRQSGETLFIGFPDSVGGYHPTRPIRVEAVLPEAARFVSSGGGVISLDGPFDGDHFEFVLSGGGSLDAASITGKSVLVELSGGGDARLDDLDVDSVEIDSSGGGAAEVSGRAGALEANLSGGGTLDAIECEAAAVSLELSGGSDASVHATEFLDVSASAGGTVVYRGDPETIEKDLSGGSELEKE
jgi:hypothetical protein